MKIDNEFTVDAPIDRAWAVLTDLETIAPCMPGAQLTGVEGDVYSGKVRIKVGPVVAQYAGTVQFREKNDDAYEAVIDASGRDARGAGTASAEITAKMREDGGRTTVTVDTDLKITGKLAQFGRGMIQEVSGKLLAQFVDCLQGKLADGGEAVATEAAASAATEPTTESEPASTEAAAPAASTAADPATEPRAASADRVQATDGATASAGQAEEPRSAAASSPAEGEAEPKSAASDTDEPAPLDLMAVAGSSLYKRLVPVIVVVVIIVVAVIVYLVVS